MRSSVVALNLPLSNVSAFYSPTLHIQATFTFSEPVCCTKRVKYFHRRLTLLVIIGSMLKMLFEKQKLFSLIE